MNGFVHGVQQRFADRRCLVDDVDKGGCSVSLTDAPPSRAVVDLDADGSPLGPTQVKCDYLFFADPNLFAPIEFKNSEPNVKSAARQLQAGARAADALIPRDRAIVCRPVLVSRSLRRQHQIDLRRRRCSFADAGRGSAASPAGRP